MRILIIDGSPRKGNTWKLTQKVIDILLTYDNTINFTEVHLSDLNLPFCMGCSNCFRVGHKHCPHNQIIQPIIDLIEENDAVIISVSSFQGQPTALMKNFTDHLAFMIHRPRFFTKKALIISTTGGVSADSTTQSLANTLPGWGFNKCYQLPIVALSWNAYNPTEKDVTKAEKVTHKFYHDVKSQKLHAPSVGVLIPFNLFQAIYVSIPSEMDYPTADNPFWRAYLGKRYAPNIPIPAYKKFLGWLIFLIGKRISKKMIITYRK